MKIEINIKKIYTKNGINKRGTGYIQTKLLGTNGIYYSTFSDPLARNLQEGMQVEMEVKELPYNKSNYDILKILSYKKNNADTEVAKGEQKAKNYQDPKNQPEFSNEASAPEYDYLGQMDKAKKEIEERYGSQDYSIGAMVAELARERFDVWLNARIQKQKEKNMGLII